MAAQAIARRVSGALFCALACWGEAAHAQALKPKPMSVPVEGERLSDWLLRQPSDPLAYTTGLSWLVPAERYVQAGVQRDLLVWLAVSERVSSTSRENLTRMIKALPVTGRMPVTLADARWLQAHPKEDPVLRSDQVVVLPRRPTTVNVLTSEGKRCTVPHRTGSEARDYLKACEPETLDRVDRAWVVQPDGTVRDLGIARWNAQTQDEAAPGALIWAPPRDSGWAPQFSALMAQFLSTQALDAIPSSEALVRGDPVSDVKRDSPARNAAVTANDWGVIGLLQTPTARMAPAGDARFTYSHVYPYTRLNTMLQPLDWLEAGFRYTQIGNRLYGSADVSGTQALIDKSIDFKVRLLKETATLPQVAIGITDIGGTGLFSSEYLVANKRSGNFDWSLGVGWGNMGSSGNVRNPFSLLSKSFDTRSGTVSSSGGQVNATSFFRGNAALFGGVQYSTPSDKWLIKAEYEGNNYQREPDNNNRTQIAPINIGLVYRYSPGIDLSVALERGNALMLSATFHTSLGKMDAPKLSDPPAIRVAEKRPTAEPIWSVTVADIAGMSGWSVRQISREGAALKVFIESPNGAYWNDRIERLTAVLHRDAPPEIEEFHLIFVQSGISLSQRVILREPWVKKALQYQAMSERFQTIAAAEPDASLSANPLWDRESSRFGYAIVPSWQQNLGGPDGFILFKAGVSVPVSLKLSENTSIAGAVSLGLLDNFANFKFTAPSNLPRVRTFLREYMTTSRLVLPNLQITHVNKLAGNQYYSLYAGYLEAMYAGVGGEWLYRPFHSPFAFGIDVNKVQQRSFEQDLSFRNAGSQTGYRVTTGHATAYWDTGWNSTSVKLSVGRYLAADLGATLDISRVFGNGVTIGAWATKTNVSSEQFGEGSFDKGIYVKIPFDVMTTKRDGNVANLVYNPLTRDGGARLNRASSLYAMTNSRSKRETGYAMPSLGASDDAAPAWAAEQSVFGDLFKTGRDLGNRNVRDQLGHAMWVGGGIVLASSLLDRPVANWAAKHQGPRMNKLGNIASNVPLLLAGGTGLLWWGLGGENASETAWTAIKSAAVTLAADTLLTIAVNRARPEANLGAAHFAPFGKGAANGSFPSSHMSGAFALVTPFARDYDAPWLYAVAGATAFGRIQQRQHFVSDVVAGSLLGYVAGALLLDQQHKNGKGPKIAIGSDRSISSRWEFD